MLNKLIHKKETSQEQKERLQSYGLIYGFKKGVKKQPFSEEHKRKIREARAKQIITQEIKDKIRKSMLGKKNNLGYRHTREAKIAIGIAAKNHEFSKEHRQKISKANKGKPNFKIRGENHPMWKGGATSVNIMIRNSLEYKIWRRTIFERDNYTCQKCKVIGGQLCVDHYPFSFAEILHNYQIQSVEEALNCNDFWDIDNGRTLCLECHKKTTTYLKPYLFSSPNPK